MAFAMIGANIIPAITTTTTTTTNRIRVEEKNTRVKKYENSCCYCYCCVSSSICGSVGCSCTFYKDLHCTSSNHGRIISNLVSHLFPIWRDAFISGCSSNTKSSVPGAKKWQVHKWVHIKLVVLWILLPAKLYLFGIGLRNKMSLISQI